MEKRWAADSPLMSQRPTRPPLGAPFPGRLKKERTAMASDMVVALSKSTVDGRTLFGHNSGRLPGEAPWLQRTPGRCFASDEMVQTQHLGLSQVRQTHTVLGS